MQKITTIGLDIAKSVTKCHFWHLPAGRAAAALRPLPEVKPTSRKALKIPRHKGFCPVYSYFRDSCS